MKGEDKEGNGLGTIDEFCDTGASQINGQQNDSVQATAVGATTAGETLKPAREALRDITSTSQQVPERGRGRPRKTSLSPSKTRRGRLRPNQFP